MRYKIWDKVEDIYTPGADASGKSRFSAAEWFVKWPWAAKNGVKAIIGAGPINGTVMMEFTATVDHYKRQGATIEDGMTDRQILDAIEEFEDTPPEPPVSPEERIAAMLEYQVMSGLEDA